MKTSFRVLALTDHRGHSQENSIYPILRTLSGHPWVEKVDVASRGNAVNGPFFYDMTTTRLFVAPIDSGFSFSDPGVHFLNPKDSFDLNHYDVIMMRLPRPISTEFLHYLAGVARGQVIVNDPMGIEKTSSKAYLLNFPELCPPIRLCQSVEDVLDFARQFPIVLKPLKEYGGKGILRIANDQVDDGTTRYNLLSYLRTIEDYIRMEGYLAMKFLKNVAMGDKRVLVVGGEILAASLRLPASGSWLCNVAQGGQAERAEVDSDERRMIDVLAPRLLEDGILIFGADTLVDDTGKRVLSEINTLSIGGFMQAEAQTGRPVLQQLVDKMMDYVKHTWNGRHPGSNRI